MGATVLAVLLALVTACADGLHRRRRPRPASRRRRRRPEVVDLTFGVWGTDEEVAAYQDVVDVYDEETDEVEVEIKTYATHDELLAALKGGEVPDVFLVEPRRPGLPARRSASPSRSASLLDERDVEFGDDYSRAALEAFSFDRDLQCMPYGISPMVVYYNTDLVDFERWPSAGSTCPTSTTSARKLRWTPRRVPGGRGVREPAAPGNDRPLRPADPRRAVAVHPLRWRRHLRRRRRAHARWPSPPTTAAPPWRRCCRSCATRGSPSPPTGWPGSPPLRRGSSAGKLGMIVG